MRIIIGVALFGCLVAFAQGGTTVGIAVSLGCILLWLLVYVVRLCMLIYYRQQEFVEREIQLSFDYRSFSRRSSGFEKRNTRRLKYQESANQQLTQFNSAGRGGGGARSVFYEQFPEPAHADLYLIGWDTIEQDDTDRRASNSKFRKSVAEYKKMIDNPDALDRLVIRLCKLPSRQLAVDDSNGEVITGRKALQIMERA